MKKGPPSRGNSDEEPHSIRFHQKVKYFAAGMVVGFIISPVIRKVLTKLKPTLNDRMHAMTEKADETLGYVFTLFKKKAKYHPSQEAGLKMIQLPEKLELLDDQRKVDPEELKEVQTNTDSEMSSKEKYEST